ncbi:MAG: biotin--[acetyl-CoA-carboxylase] ligase [Simkaniaceae bacterium]|nr:biotin--[acetyl-CoA-carboxylase] ligase [Simkaniaceae bacterium]
MFIEKFSSLESTSDYVKTHLSTLPEIGCIIATEQRGGRGQFHRPWISPPGGIYMTLFFPWPKDVLPPREMSLDAARLVKKILSSYGMIVDLKWPNDLLVAGQKIGGILTEIVDHKIIIGIGLNINIPKEALQGIDQPVTSLLIETGKYHELPPLIELITATLLSELPIK